MKFEVELLTDGRCLVMMFDGTVAVTSDDGLGNFLRNGASPPKAKRPYPKGTRKRRKMTETKPEDTAA